MFTRSEVIPDSAQECPGVDNKRDLIQAQLSTRSGGLEHENSLDQTFVILFETTFGWLPLLAPH